MKDEMSDDSIFATAIAGLDRLVHEPARLAMLILLNSVRSADFLYVMRETGLSRGNLSTHAAKLEAAGFIAVDKSFVDKTPRTVFRITDDGRRE